jgi:MSHA biogenesis protein MshQ
VTARRLLVMLALLCAACLAWLPARADTPFTVFQTFSGNVNFAGTEATLRNDSKDACNITAVGKNVTATLAGIPAGATIRSAQLYWAGSGATPDTTVTFDGVGVAAGRSYTSATTGGYSYFSSAADVTAQVAKKGNGKYTFSGLSVDNGKPWCGAEGVLGGFALLVVYDHPGQPFRKLNLYEGFQYFRNNGMTLNLSGFVVPPAPPPPGVAPTARAGYIAWIGDNVMKGGEGLVVNNVVLADPSNPAGNAFNSSSNISNDTASYGIDFDGYTIDTNTVKAGQSTATATFQTGGDMVLLGAEIVAMPYTANADLALAMTRSGDLTVGSTASYLLSVTNNGPDTEIGPVKIVDTLPSGLKFASYGGAGWSCTNAAGANGQTLVTCQHDGPLASGATMTTLALSVTPTKAGTFANSAVVSGVTGDSNSANNTASNSGGATSNAVQSFMAVFTRDVCRAGQTIVFSSDSDTSVCHGFTGPVVAGSTGTTIYLTVATINSSGVQQAASLSPYDTTVTIGLNASCLPFNPNPATVITYAGTTFDCKGTWVNVNVLVKGSQATATGIGAFSYADVGRIVLSLRYDTTSLGNLVFISRPLDIRVGSVARSDGTSWSTNGMGFTQAGDPLTVRIGAVMADGVTLAPSFGKEAAALGGVMGNTSLKFGLDLFTADPTASPVLPRADKDSVVQSAFALIQDWALAPAPAVATFQARFSWFEAGYLGMTPYLVDYLGTGQVGGPPDQVDPASAARIVASTKIVGRFYPDHFATSVTQNFDCPAALKCPVAFDAAKPAYPVKGGTFAGQPFSFTVAPFGLARDGAPQPLVLFQPAASGTRALGVTVVTAPTAGAAAAPGTFKTSATFLSDDGSGTGPKLSDDGATFALPKPYVTDQAPGSNFSAPQLMYVRAAMNETRQPAGDTVVVSSAAPASAAAGTQYEDGLMAVVGRLQVQNAFGSEMLRLSVPVFAQYWSGSAWLTHTTFGDNSIAQDPGGLKNCTRSLAQAGTTTCLANAVGAAYPNTTIALSKGSGKLVLQAPLRASGSVDYIVPGALTWLPSTRARATFGLFKSPVIYLREVY